MHSRKKFLIFLVPVIILALGYFIGVFYFQDKFLPNTYLNGENIGLKTPAEIEKTLAESSKGKTLSMGLPNNATATLNLDDVDYHYEYDKPLDDIFYSQSEYGWLPAIFNKSNYELPYSPRFDKEKLEHILENMPCFIQDIREPQNAYIEKTANGFNIVNEDYGNTPKIEIIKEVVKHTLENNQTTVSLVDNNCYEMPGILHDNKTLVNLMNSLSQIKPFTINLTDATENVTYDIINEWVSIENNEFEIDSKKIEEYVASLASKYDTLKRERSFTTTFDGEIKIGGSNKDTYGFQINQGETARAIYDNLFIGAELTPVWTESANCRTSQNDIGNTYVEISKSRQHLWVYIDGELQLETDVVTGLANTERDTTRGVFKVLGKSEATYLTGPDYRTFVNYWMPITYTGTGMHDATWRSSFGGKIYTYDGSHGCINCPLSKAKDIYSLVTVGMPVIVY